MRQYAQVRMGPELRAQLSLRLLQWLHIRPVAMMLRRYAWSAAVGLGLAAVSALALAREAE